MTTRSATKSGSGKPRAPRKLPARRIFGSLAAGVGLLLIAPAMVAAQNPAPQAPPGPPATDTTELVFEREVFSYPSFERPNPFRPLVGGGDGGPRFEQLRLLGIIQSSQAELSVALLGVAGSGAGELGETYRVRRGQTLGNSRILDIQSSRVIVEVTEFGLTEQRVLERERPGDGGSS